MSGQAQPPTYPRLDAMGESAILVSLGHGVSYRLNDRVLALADVLRRRTLKAVLDIVPAYASLLIRFDLNVVTLDEVTNWISECLPLGRVLGERPIRTLKVPVAYGGEFGPDLETVATESNLSPEEAASLHYERVYRVYFLGFMPGFPYMGDLAPRLRVPRLATPRMRVPAGSVAIASEQTGIYPLNSPGGWRILGRTAIPVWNPHDEEPAYFRAGDTVRFQPVPEVMSEEGGPRKLPPGGAGTFIIEAQRGLATIQDCGRPGLGHLGVCAGGSFDRLSAEVVNALVGNPSDAPVLEMALGGPQLR
ncbi:MAG TPA: 5-oxoprolinase subunit PxpB, partial [Chloroflexia bacterium]|nr:5-oxoprolinase subunit PxpB [Chloroflexia bacterium]